MFPVEQSRSAGIRNPSQERTLALCREADVRSALQSDLCRTVTVDRLHAGVSDRHRSVIRAEKGCKPLCGVPISRPRHDCSGESLYELNLIRERPHRLDPENVDQFADWPERDVGFSRCESVGGVTTARVDLRPNHFGDAELRENLVDNEEAAGAARYRDEVRLGQTARERRDRSDVGLGVPVRTAAASGAVASSTAEPSTIQPAQPVSPKPSFDRITTSTSAPCSSW